MRIGRKEPKDLKVVVKSKRLILWENVKSGCEKAIETAEKEIEVNKEVLKLAEKKIKLEAE